MTIRNRAFVSYSRADAEYLTRLQVHLAPYIRENKVDVWDDRRITPGARWKEEIKQAMALAKIAIVLISADFMASEFIAQNELPPLLDAAEQQGMLIVSVILSPCAFERSKLADYQSLNAPSSPLIKMSRGEQEDIWAQLAKYITDALTPEPLNEKLSHIDPPPEPNSDSKKAKIPVETGIRSDEPGSQLAPQKPITRSSTLKKRSFSWKATFGGIFLAGLILVGSVFFLIKEDFFRSNQLPGQATTTPKNHLTPTATSSVASSYDVAVTKSGIQFGFDAQRTHFNPYEENLTFASVQNLKLIWKVQTTGEVRSSSAVANGKVYVGSRDGYLYVLNANSCAQPCQPIWKAQTGYQIDSSPAVFHGIVYVGSDDQYLYAFNANGCGKPTCQPIWKEKTSGPVDTSPIVADGVVYLSAGGKLYAFKNDGTPLWQPFAPPSPTSAGFVSSPAIDHGIIYVGATDGKLYAFKVQDCAQGSCSPLWTAQTEGEIHTAPTVADGNIYVSAGGKLYAFNINSCTQSCQLVWMAQIDSGSDGDGPFSSPAVANEKVYIGSRDGYLYVFNANGCGKPTCNPGWTVLIGDPIQSSPMVAKDVVYVGSNGGFLYALNANGCGKPICNPDPKRTYSVNDAAKSSPAVADSGVYIGAGNTIYAFHLG